MTGAEIHKRAIQIRMDIVQMLEAAGSGHSAGPLGMADVYAVLYGNVLNHRPSEPMWANRDRLILSCGHTCPVRYAAMAEAGYFPREELTTLRKLGSRLQGHPSIHDMPELETTSGPLGQGLSQAVGMALSARLQKKKWLTYCILSDGEHQEGQTWEAIMLAGARHLDNLIAIVDRNKIQISGSTENVLALNPFADKYKANNWEVVEIDGNDIAAIEKACAHPHAGKSLCIIANTIPGKGVSFMENQYTWHGKTPDFEQTKQALRELRGQL